MALRLCTHARAIEPGCDLPDRILPRIAQDKAPVFTEALQNPVGIAEFQPASARAHIEFSSANFEVVLPDRHNAAAALGIRRPPRNEVRATAHALDPGKHTDGSCDGREPAAVTTNSTKNVSKHGGVCTLLPHLFPLRNPLSEMFEGGPYAGCA